MSSETPLWIPAEDAVENSQLTAFTRYAASRSGLTFESYATLHRWSVQDSEAFWSAYWDFSKLIATQKGEVILENGLAFPGARWFPGARMNFAENLLADRSDKIAFVALLETGARRTFSYAQLHDATAHIAARLKALGVAPGDRVAGWLPNIPEAAIAMLACSSIGAVWSSCSPDFGTGGALDRFGQIEPRVLFACDGYYYGGKTLDIRDKVRETAAAVDSLEKLVWVNVLDPPTTAHALPDNETNWDNWTHGDAPTLTFLQLPFDHPLYILYSSGTTGKPKCIVHGQGGTLLQHRKEHQLHLDLRPEDTLFFFTTCGWMMWNWLISALASRCTIVLFDGSPLHPDPGAMFDLAEAEAVDVFGISAKFLSSAQKAGVKPRQSHDLASLRTLISTGSPLTHEGFEYVYKDVKTNCHLVSMSGGTDIVSCFIIGNPNQPVYAGELQSPGLGMAVEIWNDAGTPVTGQKGELVCTKPFPCCPIGFWQDPGNALYRKAYFERYPNIWVHGDYAERTTNAGYIIHGRSDAVLNPGGVRIGTAEIYRQVEHFAQITDAVCVGQEWQDDVRVLLFVILKDGASLTDDLIQTIKLRIRQHASPRHVPAYIVPVADIPRTMSGKIAELAVRDILHGRDVKNTSALANPEALAHFKDISKELLLNMSD